MKEKEAEILEDYLEGYRAWRFMNTPNGFRLYSLFKGGEYPRGLATAECHAHVLEVTRFSTKKHAKIPNKKCGCGLYATWDKKACISSDFGDLFGKVRGWGNALMASGGWRSEFQMIDYIFTPQCAACNALYRYNNISFDKIEIATRQAKYTVRWDDPLQSTSSEPEHFVSVDEFLCKTHLSEIKEKNLDLVWKILFKPSAAIDLTLTDLDVKRVRTDNKYMKDLIDLSNYYEVDIKDVSNENN